jgi:YD repeat-containing protein
MNKRWWLLLLLLAVGHAGRIAAQTASATPEIDNPTGNAGALKPQITTAGSYDAHSGNATRIVNDLHVPGAVGVYGLDFTRYWNSTHNDADDSAMDWPTDFGRSGWSHSWRWTAAFEYIYPNEVPGTDYDDNRYTTAINITFPDGHTGQFKIVRLQHGEWMIPGSYPQFGPPFTEAEKQVFAYGGTGVHDHICNLATDGSEFWLCRADGGSVHFLWDASYGFQAKEVYDPHGLLTVLEYDTLGCLKYVREAAGRFLKINWQPFPGGEYLIASVQSGSGLNGSEAVQQTVLYSYVVEQGTHAQTLQYVIYDNEPDLTPGAPANQKVTAVYRYGNCWGDEPQSGVCTGTAASPDPLLKRADDPHYAGAMTAIRYNYRGTYCPPPLVKPWEHPNYVRAQAFAIAAEISDTGLPVSSFEIGCESGQRHEQTALDSWRTFYFGMAAQTADSPFTCSGYQLGKLSDFARLGDTIIPLEKQNYSAGAPRHIWDGRGIMTEAVTGLDDSGEPAEIHRPDGSVDYYDRVNPGASVPLDPIQGMRNSYNHWLFSQTHQLNATTSHTTYYTRDSRRRVIRIDHFGGSAELFTYNNFNQLTSHTLPSGAVLTYEYDGRGLLLSEYNSIDGYDARKEYTYYLPGDPGGIPDSVKTVSDGRSRGAGKDFSTRMTYNGRHQVLTVEYAGMNNASDNPMVRYGYDRNGNCTSITNELGHTSSYVYDLYRRCIRYIEPLNAQDWEGGSIVAARTWEWIYDRWFDNTATLYDSSAHTSKQWRVQVEPEFNSSHDRRLSAHKFDANDRIIEESTGLWQAGDGSWHGGADTEVHHYSYDENGQKSSYTDPLNRLTTYEYDIRNRLWKTNETVNTVARTTETLYDYAGDKTRVNFPVEAAGQRFQQWLDYDAFGQPGRFIDERGNTTNLTYQWGPMKKLSTVTTHRAKDGGGTEDQLTTFYYDGVGRPQWTIFPDGTSELTTYLFGQVDAFKTRKNQTKRVHYDARGRENYHTWDSDAAPRIDRSWDSANRLLTLSNSVSTIDYAYDDAGQPKYEGNNIAGSGSYTHVNYLRYPDGNLSYMQYPNNVWVHRDYSARGQVKNVLEWAGAWQTSVSYYYHADGKVEHQAYGNGVVTGFAYDGRGMTQVVHHQRANPFQSYALRNYTRDERDRITAFQKGTSSYNPMEDGRGDHYWYDPEGQLTNAVYGAVDPVTNPHDFVREDQFHYDALGNRVSWNWQANRGSIGYGRRDNGLNQYSYWSPVSNMTYDDTYYGGPGNGVLMQEGWITATYNALNQPKSITVPGYGSDFMWLGYDPLGRCVKRWKGPANGSASAAPIYYYFDGWNLIEEGTSPWSPARYYVHGARVDELATSHNTNTGQIAYHHFDARGHCNLLTDASGGILEQYEYDAFGFPRFFSSTAQPLNRSTPQPLETAFSSPAENGLPTCISTITGTGCINPS